MTIEKENNLTRIYVRALFLTLLIVVSVGSILAQKNGKKSYEGLVEEVENGFQKKALKLNKEFDLGSYDRWDYLQDEGVLKFSNKGITVVEATASIVGSFSTYSRTWKWSWANNDISDSAKKGISKVKEFGIENSHKHLTKEMFSTVESYAWTLTAIAGHILDAKGMYRGPIPDGYVYFVITDIRRVQTKEHSD